MKLFPVRTQALRLPALVLVCLLLVLGAVLGFVVCAGVFVLLDLMDDTYKTADDIKKYTGLVTLAVIPLEKGEEPKHQKEGGLKLPGGKTL